MSTDSILVHVEGGLARVTFNRPACLNAIDFDMGARWRDVAHEITSDASVGAVILDAAGPAFCAGGDVVAMATSGAGRRDAHGRGARHPRGHPHASRCPSSPSSPPCRAPSPAAASG